MLAVLNASFVTARMCRMCRLYSSDGNDPGPFRELILRA